MQQVQIHNIAHRCRGVTHEEWFIAQTLCEGSDVLNANALDVVNGVFAYTLCLETLFVLNNYIDYTGFYFYFL